jgi:gamma-glutamyltranspeptidase / glutathione hydrolase
MRFLAHAIVLCLFASTFPAHAADPVIYRKGVVAADHPQASQAGAAILEQGGNAVDAAVATSFALSVVRPQSCGIGGGGFMLIAMQNQPNDATKKPLRVALNFREQAPSVLDNNTLTQLDAPGASTTTGLAVAIPGSVPGLLHALETYGTLDRATVMQPAIDLARNGFLVDEALYKSALNRRDWYNEEPSRKNTHAFVWNRYVRPGAIHVGQLLTNPEQARALEMIAADGIEAWNGPIAQAIATAVQSAGGIITTSDIASFEYQSLTPLSGTFADNLILTMPPPSSGGVALLQILHIIDRFRPADPLQWNDYAPVLVEAFKHAFADRARWLGDGVDVSPLLEPNYLDTMADQIDLSQTHDPDYYTHASQLPDDAGTSHLSVIDAQGNAVSCTSTINLAFGSKLAVDEFGFCLNNEMDDFTSASGKANAFGLQQSSANIPAKGKRPLSSMMPTIILDQSGTVRCIVGASGGPRIITGTTQVILNILLLGMDAPRAVAAPRLHHQWIPNVVRLESEFLNSPTARQLESIGHSVELLADSSAVQAIVRNSAGGYTAASDPRKGGAPAGATIQPIQSSPVQHSDSLPGRVKRQ